MLETYGKNEMTEPDHTAFNPFWYMSGFHDPVIAHQFSMIYETQLRRVYTVFANGSVHTAERDCHFDAVYPSKYLAAYSKAKEELEHGFI